jgi:hypothetical protein
MRTRVFLLTAAASVLLATAPLGAAMAKLPPPDVLTIHPGGPNLPVGATIKAQLEAGTQATFYAPGSTDGVSCARGSTASTVTSNPLAPGVADEMLTAQRLGQCTSNIPEVTVTNIYLLGLPFAVTVSDAPGYPVTVAHARTKITFSTAAGTVKCTYKDSSVDGNASNTDSTITFTNQMFTLSAGPASVCPPAGDFSATFGPNIDVSKLGHPHVFVN